MANILFRERAQKMRRSGKSLNDITKALGFPKSTIRYWCRDIVLSKTQLRQLHVKQQHGGVLAAEISRKRRLHLIQQFLDQGIKDVGVQSQSETYLLWA